MKASVPKLLLHLEGLVALSIACIVYHKLRASWTEFALLFLVPDISMVGYLFGNKLGALLYNSAHTYLIPFLIGLMAFALDLPSLTPIAVIWIGHIGFDRLIGYGLKYETHFKDTHLNRV